MATPDLMSAMVQAIHPLQWEELKIKLCPGHLADLMTATFFPCGRINHAIIILPCDRAISTLTCSILERAVESLMVSDTE